LIWLNRLRGVIDALPQRVAAILDREAFEQFREDQIGNDDAASANINWASGALMPNQPVLVMADRGVWPARPAARLERWPSEESASRLGLDQL
jgi:hypothetical protein